MRKLKNTLNLKLSLWIAFSLLISLTVWLFSTQILIHLDAKNIVRIDYDEDRRNTEKHALDFIYKISSLNSDKEKENYIKNNIHDFYGNVYITDKNKNVKYKHEYNKNINIDYVTNNKEDEFKITYPITLNNDTCYFTLIQKLYGKPVYSFRLSYLCSAILSFILFVFLIYKGIHSKVKYIEYISSSINEISKGNLNYKLELKGNDELSNVASEINSMEQNLLRMINREKETYEVQNQLITNISHDLKTPLTIILGYLDIIRTDSCKSEEEKKQYVEISYEKTLLLQKMVLQLFDLVKLNNKDIKLNKSSIDINKLLMQMVTDYYAAAHAKNITIIYEKLDEPLILQIDIEKICRVFSNLLDNAVKYTEYGSSITVSLKKDQCDALISFKNKCTGLTEDDINHIFDRFYRCDKSRNSSVNGSGIGLSIAKNIVELHNGNIWADLNNDEITFTIRLRG